MPKFIKCRNYKLVENYTHRWTRKSLDWKNHFHHRAGRLDAKVDTGKNGVSVRCATTPEPLKNDVYSFNHIGRYLEPDPNRAGIAVEVIVNDVQVVACNAGSGRNLARFAVGGKLFFDGPKRSNDNWYNSVFVAIGIGKVAGEVKPFSGINAFALILHCKDTCLLLEEYAPPGTECAKVIMLKNLGSVRIGSREVIGFEFSKTDQKVMFHRNDETIEYSFKDLLGNVDEEALFKEGPLVKFDAANFVAPCADNISVAKIDVTVRKTYLK